MSDHDAARTRIAKAVAARPKAELSWRYSAARRPQPISVDDLLNCYLAIAKGSRVRVPRGSKTVTRRKFHRGAAAVSIKKKTIIFREDVEVGFTRQRMAKLLGVPRAKATALMKTLLMLGLTEIEKNHSSGRHGIVYRIVSEGSVQRPRPRPMPRRNMDVRVAIDPADDPFDVGTSPAAAPDNPFAQFDGSNIHDGDD